MTPNISGPSKQPIQRLEKEDTVCGPGLITSSDRERSALESSFLERSRNSVAESPNDNSPKEALREGSSLIEDSTSGVMWMDEK